MEPASGGPAARVPWSAVETGWRPAAGGCEGPPSRTDERSRRGRLQGDWGGHRAHRAPPGRSHPAANAGGTRGHGLVPPRAARQTRARPLPPPARGQRGGVDGPTCQTGTRVAFGLAGTCSPPTHKRRVFVCRRAQRLPAPSINAGIIIGASASPKQTERPSTQVPAAAASPAPSPAASPQGAGRPSGAAPEAG